jgi:hypothetical protein
MSNQQSSQTLKPEYQTPIEARVQSTTSLRKVAFASDGEQARGEEEHNYERSTAVVSSCEQADKLISANRNELEMTA